MDGGNNTLKVNSDEVELPLSIESGAYIQVEYPSALQDADGLESHITDVSTSPATGKDYIGARPNTTLELYATTVKSENNPSIF
jgi:hypothetical protein